MQLNAPLGPAAPRNLGGMGGGMPINFTSLNQQGQGMQGQQGGQGMHRRTPSGNVPSGVLHSFMQRTQDMGGPNGTLGG